MGICLSRQGRNPTLPPQTRFQCDANHKDPDLGATRTTSNTFTSVSTSTCIMATLMPTPTFIQPPTPSHLLVR